MSHRLVRRIAAPAFRLLALIVFFLTGACSGIVSGDRPSGPSRPPRYVFLFIGDGMGSAQIKLAELVRGEKPPLAMTAFPVSGTASTHAANRRITGSAAAGTALATGRKTTIGTIAMSVDRSADLESVAELARKRGMRVGIVSNVSIDHATPACFYAHAASRDSYAEIARQMASSGFEYFGGGFAKGALDDGRPAGPLLRTMEDSGYTVVGDRRGLENAVRGKKYWAYGDYDRSGALGYRIDGGGDRLRLADFVRAGIRLLDGERGFFMMVEGGKIDWACHANDAATTAREVEDFDEALGAALSFYRRHPAETLIVVTADHECGGLSLGNAAGGYSLHPELLRHQKASFEVFSGKVRRWAGLGNVSFSMALDSAKAYFGLGDVSRDSLLALSPRERAMLMKTYRASMGGGSGGSGYGPGDPLTEGIVSTLNSKAGIGWASEAHTAVPVPVFAIGSGAHEFCGVYDNTDIAKKIIRIAALRD